MSRSRDSDEVIGMQINDEINALLRINLANSIREGDYDNQIIPGDEDLFPDDYTEDQMEQEREEYETRHREYVVEDTDFISDYIDENYGELLEEVGSDGYGDYEPMLTALRRRLGSNYTDRDLARGFRSLREEGFTVFNDFIAEHLPEGESSEASSRNVSGGSTETTDPLPMSEKAEKNAGPVSDPTILDNIEAYTTAAEDKANRDYAASFKTGAQVAHSSFMDKIIERVEERRAKSNIEFGLPLGKSTSSASDVDSDPVSYRVFKTEKNTESAPAAPLDIAPAPAPKKRVFKVVR
jgi:hypothetical protein